MVAPLPPLPSEHTVDAHLMLLEVQGFTLIEDAIPEPMLQRIRIAFDEQVEAVRRGEPEREQWSHELTKEADAVQGGAVDFRRAYERDPAFEYLLTNPAVLPIVERALAEGRGRPKGELRMLGGPVAQILSRSPPIQENWCLKWSILRF